MSSSADHTKSGEQLPMLPGFAVISLAPSERTAQVGALLITMLVQRGGNIGAMVPVETGLDDPCEPGSAGALIRWAAGHMDHPKLVTPFAFEAPRSALHAADVAGTLPHTMAFERARAELSEGRTEFVLVDAIGPLDPITPTLTVLDLIVRWALRAMVVVPISRHTISQVMMLRQVLASRDVPLAAVVLHDGDSVEDFDESAVRAIIDTMSAVLHRPVLVMPPLLNAHDRTELISVAQSSGFERIAVNMPGTQIPQ
jgi:dethiobiotin synthetase